MMKKASGFKMNIQENFEENEVENEVM